MKFRIVARYCTLDDPYYIVQQKRWYGWGFPSNRYSNKLSPDSYYEIFFTVESAETALNDYIKELKNVKRKSEIIKVYEEPSS
jgi:hypothetical protein